MTESPRARSPARTQRKRPPTTPPPATPQPSEEPTLAEKAAEVCAPLMVGPRAGWTHRRFVVALTLAATVAVGSLISERSVRWDDRMTRWFQLPDVYISRRENVVNQFLVKRGWLWTTVALALLLLWRDALLPRPGIVAERAAALRLRATAYTLLRYIGATLWWYAMTQTLFGSGPSVFAHVNMLSGECRLPAGRTDEWPAPSAVSPRECVDGGGVWEGFDISGHCFLLIHATLLLLEEQRFGCWLRGQCRLHGGSLSLGVWIATAVVGAVVYGLCAVWYLKLVITALYHHHWAEKLVGAVLGFTYWLSVYILGCLL